MRQITPRLITVFAISGLLFTGNGYAKEANEPATELFNGWSISPAGTIVPLEHLEAIVPGADLIKPAAKMTADLPLKMIVSPDGKVLIAACAGYNSTGLAVFDLTTSKLTQFIPQGKIWNGLAFSKDATRLFVSGGDSGKLYVYGYKSGELALPAKIADPSPTAPHVFLAGIAVHPTSGFLYVANEATQEVWVINPDSLLAKYGIPTGLHPHSCVFGGDGVHLYVSNWGGRSVSILDTKTAEKVRDVAVGVRPNDMVLSPDARLFVACAGDNSVHVIQTQTLDQTDLEPNPRHRISDAVREILATSLYPSSPEGSTPCAVAVAPDGKTLYVANADNNDVMVVDIHKPGDSRIAGFIPVGWYPSALAVSPDSRSLLVANGKGLRSRPSYPPQGARAPKGTSRPSPRSAWHLIIPASCWKVRSPLSRGPTLLRWCSTRVR